MNRLARFAWAVLVYNLGVIAWGAYVRATRSGAGCGAHWPLCNGEVVPQAPSTAMLVEFTHRASSGLALLSVVALALWVWHASRRPVGDGARAVPAAARAAVGWSLFFMLTEAGVGAALVLFRLVADNASTARALFMSVHLANTFLLLACLALCAFFLSNGDQGRLAGRWPRYLRHAPGAALILVTGISGAVAALGDTLYPAGSLAEALGAELSATSHLLVRLRLFHPGLALIAALFCILSGVRTAYWHRGTPRRLGLVLAVAAGVQLVAGFVNVLLLAPVWMQIVHLLLADTLWITYVLLAGTSQERSALAPVP